MDLKGAIVPPDDIEERFLTCEPARQSADDLAQVKPQHGVVARAAEDHSGCLVAGGEDLDKISQTQVREMTSDRGEAGGACTRR